MQAMGSGEWLAARLANAQMSSFSLRIASHDFVASVLCSSLPVAIGCSISSREPKTSSQAWTPGLRDGFCKTIQPEQEAFLQLRLARPAAGMPRLPEHADQGAAGWKPRLERIQHIFVRQVQHLKRLQTRPCARVVDHAQAERVDGARPQRPRGAQLVRRALCQLSSRLAREGEQLDVILPHALPAPADVRRGARAATSGNSFKGGQLEWGAGCAALWSATPLRGKRRRAAAAYEFSRSLAPP